MDDMFNKYSFEEIKAQLIAEYLLLPSRKTLNYFIRSCFYDSFKNSYTNLGEENRRSAYFYGFIGSEVEYKKKEEEYRSKFPKVAQRNIEEYGVSGTKLELSENFEDLIVSDLSVQILNNNYFEFRLSQQLYEFKKKLTSLIDENVNTKKYQLYALIEEIEKRKELVMISRDIKLDLKNIDYYKFYDLVDIAQKNLTEFIENKKKFLNSVVSLKEEVAILKYFTSIDNFHKFKEYLNNTFSNWHKDISYVKKRMQGEGIIHNHTDFEFIDFLYENDLIKEDIHEFLKEKGQLDTLNKSKSKIREEWYRDAFGC